MFFLNPSRHLSFFLAVLFLGLGCGATLAAPPTSAPTTAPTTLPGAMPRTPGFHHLYFPVQYEGQPRTLAYSVYLPKNYNPAKPCPMIVYLVGLGDRGENHQGLFNNGPPVYLSANPELADWAPFIVLAPQCPKDLRWETPGVAKMVSDLIDHVTATLAVDPDRLYLTGLSNGGTGCWNIALAAPQKFAALAVFCGMDADTQKMPEAVAGSTVLIVVGSADTRFTIACHKMYEALLAAKIDTLLVEIPGGKHGIWPAYYADRGFYEFLLLHRRHAPLPATRPTTQELLTISQKVSLTADNQLARALHAFLPWWFINNCGRENSPGLKGTVLGRRNVFVTTPLSKDVACRLMYTADLPAGKKTTLNLTVAAPPKGQWKLLVRGNGEPLLQRLIGVAPTTLPSTAPTRPAIPVNPWVSFQVDLTPLAGQQVYLELLNASVGN